MRPEGRPDCSKPGRMQERLQGGQGPRFKNARSDTKAVIDIGSNSIKLRVARKRSGRLRTLVDTTEVVGLGRGLGSGLLQEGPIRNGVSAVRRFVRLAEGWGACSIRLVATMALRSASNAEDFVRRVHQKTGLTVEILPGEEEARLAWLGAIYGLGMKSGKNVVFDTGGGSTEFIVGLEGGISESRSLPLGAVLVTEKFFNADPVLPESLEKAKNHILSMFESEMELRAKAAGCPMIGIGGGVVAIASVKLGLPALRPKIVNGTLLTSSDIDSQVELYASRTLAERMEIPGLPPKRADIILASACIVQGLMKSLRADSFKVSINGLRHGLLVEMFKPKDRRRRNDFR